MTVMAVMALLWVTPGACMRVPISGAKGAGLTGQVTKPGSLATGADKSEPHGTSWPAKVCRAPCVHRYGGGVGCGMYPGCRVVPGSVQEARTNQWCTSAYTGVPVDQAGAGAVPEQCKNSARNSVRNSAITDPTTRHPTTRQPTPDTRHPVPTTCNVSRVYRY